MPNLDMWYDKKVLKSTFKVRVHLAQQAIDTKPGAMCNFCSGRGEDLRALSGHVASSHVCSSRILSARVAIMGVTVDRLPESHAPCNQARPRLLLNFSHHPYTQNGQPVSAENPDATCIHNTSAPVCKERRCAHAHRIMDHVGQGPPQRDATDHPHAIGKSAMITYIKTRTNFSNDAVTFGESFQLFADTVDAPTIPH